MRRFLITLALFLSFSGAGQAQEEFFRLVNETGALNLEHGSLQAGEVGPGWWSAMWERGDVGSGNFIFRNRYTGEYLVKARSHGQEGVGVTSELPSPTGSGPHFWHYGSEGSRVFLLATGEQAMEVAGPVFISTSKMYVEDVIPEAPPEVAPPIVYYRLLKGKDPLNVEQGPPVFSPAGEGFFSAMWEVQESRAGDGLSMVFTNRWTGQVLSSSGTSLITQAPTELRTGQEPFLWRAVKTGKNLEFLELSNSQGAKISQVYLQQVK